MNKLQLEQVVSDDPLEVLAHDYAFLYNIKTNRQGFSDESNHQSFVRKHESLKDQALAQFKSNYEEMFAKYKALRNQYPQMLNQMKAESLQEMAYQKPNFEKVWPQVSNNMFVNSLGVDKWIELAQSGKDSKISLPSMDKVLDYDPSVKGKDNVKHSHVDMPIILKSPMGDYHLLNGNDTLNAIMDLHGNAKVWYVDASNVNED